MDRQGHGRLAVQRHLTLPPVRSEFDAGHVLEADHAGLGVGLQDDLRQRLRVDLPAHGTHRDRARPFLLPRRPAGRRPQVLLLQCAHHLRSGQVAGGQLLRIEPDSQAVVTPAEQRHIGHSGQPRQLVLDLDVGVVTQVETVIGAGGGAQRDEHQHAGWTLPHLHAGELHHLRKDRHGQAHAILHEQLVDLGVSAAREGDGEDVLAVVGAAQAQRQDLLEAADLLLDGGGDRVGE